MIPFDDECGINMFFPPRVSWWEIAAREKMEDEPEPSFSQRINDIIEETRQRSLVKRKPVSMMNSDDISTLSSPVLETNYRMCPEVRNELFGIKDRSLIHPRIITIDSMTRFMADMTK